MNAVRLILASASPRRATLLRTVGWTPEVRPARIDEAPLPDETPEQTVARLARTKAETVAFPLREDADVAVLAADTAVVLDGEALGKPSSPDEARAMLRRLSGRTHRVLTGVFLTTPHDGAGAGAVESTEVRFRRLDDAWIEAYVATGEPMDKAGAYGIQERGVWLTRGIRGSWSNVVGLPLERLPELFAGIGVDPHAAFNR
jgi:septum formation protein